MSVRQQLIDQLRHFDDEAYAAIANRGLLRRAQKDLEKLTPAIIVDTDDQLQLSVGGHQIGFSARGVAAAHCSCPAAGVCQHILSVALWLQQSAPASDAAVETSPATDRTALHEQLMALKWPQLQSYAGKPGGRWALQYVADLAMERDVVIGGEHYILIRFMHPRMEFRYMGGPPDSLIADIESAHLAKYRVAAILAYQRAHGVEVVVPDDEKKESNAALDLGKSHTGVVTAATSQRDSRRRLLDMTQHFLREMVTLGLSHLSSAIQDRATTLAVWAQGAEYYRLALALRRIAHQVELHLERSAAADEHRLFDDITVTYALVCALNTALGQNRQPEYLTGTARSRYEAGGTLQLWGLGANAWRTASGFIGMTMLFWSPTEKCFFSCTDSRPAQQRQFDPALRYRSPGPWTGLGAPSEATGNMLTLSHAQSNQAGRLSASATTHAIVQRTACPQDLIQTLAPISDWQELERIKREAASSVLAELQPLKDYVVLKPASFGKAGFDAIAQRFKLPLIDGAGSVLSLELPYSDLNKHPIERLEQLSKLGIPEHTLVVAKLGVRSRQLIAEPLSLIYDTSLRPGQTVDALYFDPLLPGSFQSQYQKQFSEKDQQEVIAPIAQSQVALEEVRHMLQREAERGIGESPGVRVSNLLRSQIDRLSTMGLTVFDNLLLTESEEDFTLKINLIILQLKRFLD